MTEFIINAVVHRGWIFHSVRVKTDGWGHGSLVPFFPKKS